MKERAHGSAATPRPVSWQLGAPAAVGAAFLLLPLLALVTRAPWRSLPEHLSEPAIQTSLRLSLVCATAAAGTAILLGVPLAWVLARSRARGIGLIRALVTVPLVLPPVVGGVALLKAFGRNGLLGRWLDEAFGVTLPFTTTGVIVAETFVAMPFLVLAMEGAFRSIDPGLEEAATTLGASRWFAFTRVSLPSALPGLLAGSLLAWARALGEFGATITFAGNSPGRTTTMPISVYLAMERDPDAAVSLALVLLMTAVIVLVALRGRWLTT
ncbi:MAG: ABC transporter permease [Tetrasphaera jenkinsii]|jgi:molybdate transport system permease protein|nr:ABC transporter permease [Tetrasphaera jenkinsii]